MIQSLLKSLARTYEEIKNGLIVFMEEIIQVALLWGKWYNTLDLALQATVILFLQYVAQDVGFSMNEEVMKNGREEILKMGKFCICGAGRKEQFGQEKQLEQEQWELM